MANVIIEEGIVGIEEKETLSKEEFFNMLNKKPEGVILTVEKVNKPFNSKFQDKNNTTDKKKKALYLWYNLETEGVTKKVELAYNLDYEVEPNTFKLDKNSLLFKLLSLTTPDIKGLSGVTINYNKLSEKLTGIKFKAISELIKGKNNTYSYILKPVKLI